MKFKELIQKAHDIRNESTGVYRTFKDKLDLDLQTIAFNRDLSEEGIRNQQKVIRENGKKELSKMAKSLKNAYLRNLAEARKEAEMVIAKVTKPSEEEKAAFQAKLKELSLDLTLTLNHSRAKQKLDEFLQGVDNDVQATLVRDSFAEIISPVMSRLNGSDVGMVMIKYRTMYDTLETKFKGEEYVSAVEAIKSINSLENGSIFSPIVEGSVRDALGPDAVEMLRNPDNYLSSPEFTKDQAESLPLKDLLQSRVERAQLLNDQIAVEKWSKVLAELD